MTTRKIFFLPLLILSAAFLFMTSCKPEEASTSGKIEMKMTDAPVDDASIQGVFVTVTEVKVDGESYSGFQGKQTIDIMAYQNGQTKVLGLADLEAGSYSQITLVLDTETDASGNTPGCYVLKANNEKEKLEASTQGMVEVTSQAAFEVVENTTTSVVIDFDLRKCLQYENPDSPGDRYSFVNQDEFNAGLRVISEEKSGSLSGEINASLISDPEKVIVYVYKKGTFNKDTETQAQGSGKIQFKGAVTSVAAMQNSGSITYKLSFLEEGEYEICMASYEDTNDDGKFTFNGFLNANIFVNGSVTTDVVVGAGLTSSLNLNVIGIIN